MVRGASACRGRRGHGQLALAGAGAGAGLVMLLAATSAHAACGDGLPKAGRQTLAQGGLQVVFVPRPAPWSVGRHFALDIALCPLAGAPAPTLLGVDAEMPAHRHGMNYRPSIRRLGNGRFVADGLMLHMPGQWRLWFEVQPGPDAAPLRLAYTLDLP